MADIFISYKHQDREKAHALAEYFIGHGYDVWWDIELLPGQQFADEINTVINQAKAVIVLWTPDSVNSVWVKSEAFTAMERGTLVPVWLKKVDLPVPYNTLHTIDLASWEGDSTDPILASLLQGVSDLIGRSGTAESDSVVLEDELKKYRPEAEYWKTITSSQLQSAEEYRAYLNEYGDEGNFSELAKIRLDKLLKEEPVATGYSQVKKTLVIGLIFVVIFTAFLLLTRLVAYRAVVDESQDNPALEHRVQSQLTEYLGEWVAHPMEIYTEVSPGWLEFKQSRPSYYFNANVIDALIKLEYGERSDELLATIVLINETFDHRFKALIQVSGGELWMTKVKHMKQYGAEPNLEIKRSKISKVKDGKLYVELEMTDYATISFFAEPKG